MAPPPEKKKTRLISPLIPVAVLGATVVGLLLSRPGADAIAGQFLKEGKPEEALRTLRAERAKSGSLANPDIDNLEYEALFALFVKADAAGQRAIWGEAYMRGREIGFPLEPNALLIRMTLDLKDPEGLWESYRPFLVHRDSRQVCDALVKRYLGIGRPGKAAEIEVRRLRDIPVPRASDLLRLASMFRQAGDDNAAIAALDRIAPEQMSAAIEAEKLSLYRAAGRNLEALALYSKLLEKRDRVTMADIAAMAEMIRQSGDFPKALAIAEKHVPRFPDEPAAFRLWSDLLVDTGRLKEARAALVVAMRRDPDNLPDLRRLAQLSEWSGDYEGAQEAWLRLAILGEPGATGRLKEMNAAPKHPELVERLALAVEKPGREADLVPVAEFLALLGEYDSACKLYGLYLRGHPDDIVIVVRTATIMEETGDPEGALPLLKHAVKLKPDDADLHSRLAAVLLSVARPVEALDEYAAVNRIKPNPEGFDLYIRLAESLGKFTEAADSAETALRYIPEVKPDDYLRVANLRRRVGDATAAATVLTRALERFPKDPTLRYQLASLIADRLDYAKALAILEPHPDLRTDGAVVALYLDLLRLTDARPKERAYLGEEIPPVALTTPSLKLRVSRALNAIGRRAEALDMQRELYEQSPADREIMQDYIFSLLEANKRREAVAIVRENLSGEDAESLRIAALVYAEARDYRRSETALAKLVALPGQGTEPNLSTLGDIRLSSGDLQGARQAYAAALHEITSRKSRKLAGGVK